MRILHDPDVRASIDARLTALSPDARRQWGTMSVDQMLWHVNQYLAAAMGEGTMPVQKNPMPLPILRFMLMYMPWPKSAPTNPGAVTTSGHDFEAERARCRELIEQFVRRPINGSWPPDPTFGDAGGKFASRLQARHLDHHLRQFGA